MFDSLVDSAGRWVARLLFPGRKSLQKYLAVSLVLFVCVSTAVFIVVSTVVRQSLVYHVTHDNVALAQSISAIVNGYLDEPLSLVREISALAEKNRYYSDQQFEVILASHLRSSPYLESVMILDSHGIVRHVIPYDENISGIDLSTSEYFIKEIGSDRPYWSNTFISPSSGDPSVVISMNMDKGVAVGVLSLTNLAERINSIQLTSRARISVIDSNGVYIVDPDRKKVVERIVCPDLPKIRKKNRETSSFISEFDGSRNLVTACHLRGTGWYVLVSYDEGIILGSVNRAIWMVWTGIIILIIVVVSTGYRFLRVVSRSVDSIILFSRQVGAGNYGGSVRVNEYKEFIPLTENLLQMREKIIEREQALQSSEHRFRVIILNLPVAIGILETEGNISYLNPAFTSLFGYSIDDFHTLKEWAALAYPDEEYRKEVRVW
ncbi:MAG TPA: cache domain-containing protein, partial [Spirochaetota bacterium]